MNLHKLRVFRAVVESQSLTATAQQFVVSQPVIHAHVRDLEAEFGAKLLHKQGRRMLPTEAGEAVYHYAVEVLRSTDETMSVARALATGEAGSVVVGANMAPGTYLLPGPLTAFRLQHPSARISLQVSDPTTVLEHILAGVYDFGLLAILKPPAGFHAEVFSEEPLVVVAGRNHARAGGGAVPLATLMDERWICTVASNQASSLVDAHLRERGLARREVDMVLSHPEAVKQAVERDAGIAMLFRCSVEREVREHQLLEVQIQDEPLVHPFFLVHHPRKHFSPLQQRLIAFLRAFALEPGQG